MLNVGRIKIKKGSSGKNANFPVTRDADGWVYGIGEYIAEVAVTGSLEIDLSAVFSAIDSVQLTLKAAASTDADKAPVLTYGVDTAVVTVYGWKATNSSTTTLVAADAEVTVSVCIRGTLLASV